MKTLFSLLTAIFAFAAVSSCSSDDENTKRKKAEPIVLRSTFDQKIEQDNRFAFDFFKTTYRNTDEPDIFVSPLSVSMALSMTMNGAKGNTLDEMRSALRISGYSMDEVNEYAKTMREALLKVDPATRIDIANSIWNDIDFSVEPSFTDVNKNYYDAETATLDFSSKDAVTRINNWCADKTNDKITEIIQEIPDNAVMYLINAVYFKGIWESQFDKKNTYKTVFHAEDGEDRQVQMMTQKHQYGYAEDENASYLEMPYGNGAFSMVVILPDENKTVGDVIENMSPASWDDITKRLSPSNIVVHIPRFKLEAEYKLNRDILPQMGMIDAFNEAKADFSGINPNRGLFISAVTHKTYVEVNEEGTEAAAVTSVQVGDTAVPQELVFRVDRPFLFLIKEQSTGIILFMGKMGDIAG